MIVNRHIQTHNNLYFSINDRYFLLNSLIDDVFIIASCVISGGIKRNRVSNWMCSL